LEECGPCPVFASYTLAFALQLRKKHGKTSVRVFEQQEYVNPKNKNTQITVLKQEYDHILIKIRTKRI
jgi:hypothetical protein